MKKILLLFLTLTLVLTSASVFASCDNSSDSPDETNYSEGLEYNYYYDYETNTWGFEVSGIGTFTGSEVVIPPTLDGIPVIRIASRAFEYLNTIDGFNPITSVIIPDGVTTIGVEAFKDCFELTSITIPKSLTYIGAGAFTHCFILEKIYYKGDINSWVQINFGKSESNYDDDEYSFTPFEEYGHTQLYINGSVVTNANINTATSINNYAFYDLTSLTKVTIGNQVISIGKEAFYDCNSLTSVTFENTSGWYIVDYSDKTSGIDMDVTDSSQNATYLKSTYCDYYWKRK